MERGVMPDTAAANPSHWGHSKAANADYGKDYGVTLVLETSRLVGTIMRQSVKTRIRENALRSGLGLPRYLRELILQDRSRRPTGTGNVEMAELQAWLHDIETDRSLYGR